MVNPANQQTWVPYEPIKDCSMGFCSIYCPQWCYVIFPPPPNIELSYDSSGPTFSPLVIAVIGILASAFLLLSYYTIITKYCDGLGSLRRRLGGPNRDDVRRDDNLGQSHLHEAWHVSRSNGLDEGLINRIAVHKYKIGDGVTQGTDCSVCLSEFREDESLRLLPKCSHAFHLQCIDTWLKSHSNCPLCRANIVPASSASPPPQPPPVPPEASREREHHNEEIVIVIEDVFDGEENHLRRSGRAAEESSSIAESGDEDVQPIRRSVSLDYSRHGRLLIADVLQMSMDDEILAAKENGFWLRASSSRRAAGGGEHVKGSGTSRGLHCVMSPVPVPMKRSFSSGRFCLTRNTGRGRNGVNPV